MSSCLFGGPPVLDDLVKLGESQIGFINIFSRPLFEAVADILPSMRYVVDEILINKDIWEKKIEEERERRKNNPGLTLNLLTPSFAADPSPSPFSESPSRATQDTSKLPPSHLRGGHSAPRPRSDEDASRRASTGSLHNSSGTERGSRRSSANGMPGSCSRENQGQSRRGSGDPSLTAILVTQTPNPSEPTGNSLQNDPVHGSKLPGERKDTLTKSSPKREKETLRPVTAPSSARRSQGKRRSPPNPLFHPLLRPLSSGPDLDSATNLFPVPRAPSQSHSEVDLTHSANGNLDGPKLQQWDPKMTGDANVSRTDGSRDVHKKPGWWRHMSSSMRPKDVRNGEHEGHSHEKNLHLEPTLSNPTSDATSPTPSSPGRPSRTGKLKSFFKRRPRNSSEQDKQLSSYGSSSQLRTPPTSDPGRSLNSDE